MALTGFKLSLGIFISKMTGLNSLASQVSFLHQRKRNLKGNHKKNGKGTHHKIFMASQTDSNSGAKKLPIFVNKAEISGRIINEK
jgi:hypothetical protein